MPETQSNTYLSSPVTSKTVEPKMRKSRKVLLALLAVALVALAVGVAVGMLLASNMATPEVNNSNSSQSSTTTSASTTQSATSSVEDDETAGWETYTNNDPVFTVKYPSDWVLDSSESELGSGDLPSISSTTISKDEYIFRFTSSDTIQPSACYYDDYPQTEEKPTDKNVDAYVEIVSNAGVTYRRDAVPTLYSSNPPIFEICSLGTSGFTTGFSPSFQVPVTTGAGEEYVEIMDLMLENFKLGE